MTAPELDLMAVVADIRDHVTSLWGPAPTHVAEPGTDVQGDPGATITYENGPVENPGTVSEAHWVHIYVRDHASMWPQVTLQPRQPHVLAVYPWPAD